MSASQGLSQEATVYYIICSASNEDLGLGRFSSRNSAETHLFLAGASKRDYIIRLIEG